MMMRRRSFLAGAALLAAPFEAAAQAGLSLTPIQPENALERAFLAALANEAMRPPFRRQLLVQPVTLALESAEPDAAARTVALVQGGQATAIFTSAARLTGVLGAEAASVTLPGREILTRVRAQRLVLNYRLLPMLTLDPEDVERILELPA
jgi:hypothetical protein